MSHVGSDVGVRGSKEQEETGVPGEKPPAEAWVGDHLPSHKRPFAESEIRSRTLEVRSKRATTALTRPEDNEVDLDPLANQTPDDDTSSKVATKSAGKKKKGKKKDDDWEDDVAEEIKALSLQSKGDLNESEEEEEIVVPVKKKKKKKNKKVESDEEEEEEMKPKGTFQMLMIEDDDMVQSESDNEMEEKEDTPVIEAPKENTVKPQKKKDKKKDKKDTKQEEDIDALLAELDKPSEKSKKKKKKKGEEEETTEAAPATGTEEQQEVDIEAKMAEAKVVSIDDFDEEEDDKKKKKREKKKKAKKADAELKDGEEEGEKQEGENEGEGEEGSVKTAAQKRKEKKEREKLKKQQEKKKSKSKGEGATGTEDQAEGDKEGEGKDDAEEDEGEEKEGKKKKKKGEKEEKKKKSKAPVAAIKAQLQKIKEEEERLKREEEERIRKEEEEERLREEQKRLEEERKLKKKQKEKEKKQRLKEEGKLLTAKEKQDRRRALQLLEQMKAQGIDVPDKGESAEKDEAPVKKRPVYTNKKKKPQKQELESTPSPTEEVKPLEPEPQVTENESQGQKEESKEEVKDSWVDNEEEGGVKDDWDAESEEEKEEEEEKDVPMETEKKEVTVESTTAEKKEEVDVEEEDEEEDEESDDESEEEESDEEDDDDEEESEEESEDDDDDLTPVEKARERIMKYHEECEKNRSVDKLRAAVVCVLGHVDTGKTKILDKLRRTHVQDGEAGGITQQIGATNVPESAIREQTKMCKEFSKAELKLPGLLIIDTPGHESFSNLRSRGSSLCDIAILVVDIMHGLEPQTIESLNLLRQRKTPFLIALNKIDRLYQWKTSPHTDVQNTIKKQSPHTKSEFDERAQEVIVQMAEQGINAALYYENKNPREYVSLVPTSAHSGDGMGNLIALICELTQTMLAKRVSYSEELQATVMEVKALPGLGTTIDVILVNGHLRESDQIVVPGTEGPIVTHIRGLLMPQPMKELRVKSQWEHHKEVYAAQGVKIIAKDFEKALAGLPMYVAKRDDEVEYYKEELSTALKDVLSGIKLSERGVFVQASTLGSLEALLEFLRTSKIPYAGINIGPVHKKDIMKASVMIEHDLQYAVILAFDVKVEREAQEMADSVGVKIFTADIIYHLFDKFIAYRDEFKKKKQEEFKHIAVFPCKLRVLPQFIFNSRDPIVVGVCVEAGFVKEGTPLCVPSKEGVELGRVVSVENNHKPVDKATKGMEVCIKIDPIPGDAPKMYGRHFDHTDLLYSKISRESIDAVKNYFREEMAKSDWQLVMEMKKLFQIL
ncbi:hypothetical protein FSP39_014100 [Pinctada imbricata]|uniref:Eukaryotic translation initiation factor 5B n=1 Tax=Pinctada imbricata TaxID=66713 RepID=A0AA88YMQ1_PINIB|nr:hypothetical protein FSP39_014100 [Pinctada imbricata]